MFFLGEIYENEHLNFTEMIKAVVVLNKQCHLQCENIILHNILKI